MNSSRALQFISRVIFGFALVAQARAVVLVDDTQLVSASTALASATTSATFSIATAGSYRLTIKDLLVLSPSTLTSVRAVVTHSGTVVAQLDQTGPGQTTVKDFTAQPGNYAVHVIGKASGAAQASIEVGPAVAGTPLYAGTVTVQAPTVPPSDTSDLQTKIHIFQAGAYTLTLNDGAFPVALQSYDLILLDSSSNHAIQGRLCFPSVPPCAAGNSFSFNAVEGDYDLEVIAVAGGSDQAGLFSITVSGAAPVSGAGLTYRVGKMPAPVQFALPTQGSYSLSLGDLNFPGPLTSLHAALVQADAILVSNAHAGATSFTAQAGNAELYTLATATDGFATYSRQVLQGAQTLFGDIQTTASSSFAFTTQVSTLGTYTAQLKDFTFPSAFLSLQAVVSQDGVVRATIPSPGMTDVQLNAGNLHVLVIPTLQVAIADPNALLGLSVSAKGSGAKVLEATQGVGNLFQARTFTVTDAGNYDVRLTDLAFPVAFSDLAVAVTRGPTMVGQIFGGGSGAKFSFPATPGDYTLNFIAKAGGTSAEYGLYAANVATSPPAPVVTLTASPTAVAANATATLTWSTTGADSCVASGGWTGTKGTSGSTTSPAITANTTFTLTCTGAGGSTNAAAAVTVTQPSAGGGGGGGSTSTEFLLALLAVLSMSAMTGKRRSH